MSLLHDRPPEEEVPSYYRGYVDLVPDGDVLATLERQVEDTLGTFERVGSGREHHRYREGAWTIREVLGHLVDTERLFVYRALSIGRADPVALPGMDQDAWAAHSNADERPLDDQGTEWRIVRTGTLELFRGMDEPALERTGTASGHEFRVSTFAWIIAGHELHHRRILDREYAHGG